jgi:hypothetical protein
MLADGRLAQAERLPRGCEVPCVDHGQEGAQEFDLKHIPSFRNRIAVITSHYSKSLPKSPKSTPRTDQMPGGDFYFTF